MGGFERFWVGEYDGGGGGGGLSEKMVFWSEIVDKADGHEGFGFRWFDRRSTVRNGGKGSVDREEWIDGGASGQIASESGEQRWRRSQLFWLFFSGDLWIFDGGRCLGFDGQRFMI